MKESISTYREQITSLEQALTELTGLRDLAMEKREEKIAKGDYPRQCHYEGEVEAYHQAVEIVKSLIVNTPKDS